MPDEPAATAERKAKLPLNPERFRAIFLLLLVVGISLLFFEMIRPFLTALFLGAIFSGLLYPAYQKLRGWLGGRRSLASFATLLLFVVLLLGPSATFLTIVANQAVQVTESAGPWIDEMRARLDEPDVFDRIVDRIPFAESIRPYQPQITEKMGELASSVGGFVIQGLTDVTRGTVTVIFLLFVMLYAMFFFLKDGRRVLRTMLYYLPLSDEDEHRMLDRFVSVTRATVKGTFLIGIVQGALAGIGFWVAGIPSAVFWGTVMAVLSIVPGVGAALVFVPACIYLVISGQLFAGMALFVWCGGVVGTVDNLMRPWLVGRDTKMPDLMILLGTLGGLFVFGASGVIIGPIVAALFITVWQLYGEAFRDLLPAAVLSDIESDDPLLSAEGPGSRAPDPSISAAGGSAPPDDPTEPSGG